MNEPKLLLFTYKVNLNKLNQKEKLNSQINKVVDRLATKKVDTKLYDSVNVELGINSEDLKANKMTLRVTFWSE